MKWRQVVSAMRNLGEVIEGGVGCAVVLAESGRRGQHVGITPGQDGSVITVWAAVCPAPDLDGQAALRYNATTTHEALALYGETYVLRRALETEWLSAGELLGVVEALAIEAEQIHRVHVLAQIVDEANDRCDRLFTCSNTPQ